MVDVQEVTHLRNWVIKRITNLLDINIKEEGYIDDEIVDHDPSYIPLRGRVLSLFPFTVKLLKGDLLPFGIRNAFEEIHIERHNRKPVLDPVLFYTSSGKGQKSPIVVMDASTFFNFMELTYEEDENA